MLSIVFPLDYRLLGGEDLAGLRGGAGLRTLAQRDHHRDNADHARQPADAVQGDATATCRGFSNAAPQCGLLVHHQREDRLQPRPLVPARLA